MSQVRKARMEDLEKLAFLFDQYRIFYKQSSDLELAQNFIKERLEKQDSEILVVIKDQRLLGFTQLYPTFSSVSAKKSWILNDLFVVEEARNKGLATDLLEEAKKLCITTKAKGLALETANDNPAQKLYERLGWEKDESFLHYFWMAP